MSLARWSAEMTAMAELIRRLGRRGDVASAGETRASTSRVPRAASSRPGHRLALAGHDSIADDSAARRLVEERERQLKHGLARLQNRRALENWGGESSTGRLSYRWPNARQIISDVNAGLVDNGRRPMLEPEGRHLLLDALRPPTGYAFDRAVGTTFSLDLAALLTAPVGFALLDRESQGRAPDDRPVALLEAVRANADRIDVFCQAGLIGLPPNYQAIVSYLETSIHEVTAPRDGYIFHPKVWFIRYRRSDEHRAGRARAPLSPAVPEPEPHLRPRLGHGPAAGGGSRSRRRSLRTSRSRASSAACPSMADAAAGRASPWTSSRRWRPRPTHVRFTPPPGFDERRVRARSGLDRRKPDWPFAGQRVDRMLVVSPFVTRECLEQLDRPRSDGRDILITRAETFDELGAEAVSRFGETFTLSGDATSPDEADEPDAQSARARS